ncbi:1-deoxy-D-xylulose-5-phosphate synthase [Butyrivibrio sp. ob235]|uniref:1-deoxy-D-xylulose-5-phosphate synthase n=1 Tax=Butyrivibrio sp. ob235 TaxID=1761780 RepID=UPI0008D5EF35|nr:1-deoxy-D-xylulose-5-phosphate synthase [Butyrivibrio sp. ob235]SEL42113.1 1-deoxy-D-xylulose-5-phosphate synthase [Butyrivibrio sp. ob235]
MLLDSIKKPNDIKKIPKNKQGELAQEIRDFLIEKISVTGGHLASNLGVVELTMALHLELDLPKDKIIWDVGHQSYTHKLLTGRKDGFDNLRKFGGMSGFPKRSESECDCFDTGHSSTSLSAGLGMVRARQLSDEKFTIVSVIGDGSLTGGLAYEALNNAAKLDTNFIMVLNDNEMSISENVGGMAKYLNVVRTNEGYLNLRDDIYNSLKNSSPKMVKGIRRAKNSFKQLFVPGMVFENLGITYLGPIDGHDITALRAAIREAKKVRKAVMIHVVTKKGKGYEPAERHPARFHGTEPFLIENGIPRNPRTTANYQDIFSTVMCKIGEREPKAVAITAAMADGTGLKRFRNMYPDRFFDAGIAEEHAVTFAAGLAVGGFHPIFAVYSSFLQRAYDQVLEDVCLQNLPVTFAIDRAGLVGSDGETHQGIFDLSYLSSMPNMHIMAPKNKWELSDMLKFAIAFDGPSAIRYPRGTAYDGLADFRAPIEMGKAEPLYKERDIILFALGSMVKTAEKVREILLEKGYNCSLTNARFAKPIDGEHVRDAAKKHKLIVTMEENVENGGFGDQVRRFIYDEGIDIHHLCIALPDEFVTHGSCDQLYKALGVDAESIAKKVMRKYEEITVDG